MRLLLAEDDVTIGEAVLETMRRAGYTIGWARDGREAESSLIRNVYDLVLLDQELPKLCGLDVLIGYRRRGGSAPVMILTDRDSVEDRIAALDAGADDCLVKPFDLEEMAARVRAILRRHTEQSTPIRTHDDLTLNPVNHEATLGDEPLLLLPKEFRLLQILIEEPKRVFTRLELENKLYGRDRRIGSNAIEVHVSSLRRKVGAERLVTVRGVGYRLGRRG